MRHERNGKGSPGCRASLDALTSRSKWPTYSSGASTWERPASASLVHRSGSPIKSLAKRRPQFASNKKTTPAHRLGTSEAPGSVQFRLCGGPARPCHLLRVSVLQTRPQFHCHSFPKKVPAPGQYAVPGSPAVLVNGANQIIAHAAHNDHGRNGPHDEYWHFRLLKRPRGNASFLPLVPVRWPALVPRVAYFGQYPIFPCSSGRIGVFSGADDLLSVFALV